MTTSTGDPTDRQLLERFATRRDEEGFAQLVRRHGPMVLGVCRQILRHDQDAEDAFQATFLVLARKAGSIRSPEALPNWLYGVATRLATRMKVAASRRHAREVPLVDVPTSAPAPGGEFGDLGPLLHEEIGRLPDKYRLPFVLCYLDGKTNEQAAQQLGCPPGTVFSRLARARERLRTRLTRRGLVLSAGVLAATLSSLSEQASAAVPPPLASTTVRGAMRFAAGKSGSASDIPARIVALAEWGLKSLSGRRLASAVAVLVLVGLLGTTLGLLLRPRSVEQPVDERLQGTWNLTAMIQGGNPIPGVQGQITLDGQRLTFVQGAMKTSGTYRIDAEKNPMRLDWILEGGVLRGIFALHDDTLTMCVDQPADGRPVVGPPADFSPRPGRLLMVFERQRP